MFIVIGIMVVGIAVGYLLREQVFVQKTGKLIAIAIIVLLFLLGITVGANEEIVNNLSVLGGQALAIAASSVAGSVICAWLVSRFIMKGKLQG